MIVVGIRNRGRGNPSKRNEDATAEIVQVLHDFRREPVPSDVVRDRVMDVLGIDRLAAGRLIRHVVDDGRVARLGTGRHTKYAPRLAVWW